MHMTTTTWPHRLRLLGGLTLLLLGLLVPTAAARAATAPTAPVNRDVVATQRAFAAAQRAVAAYQRLDSQRDAYAERATAALDRLAARGVDVTAVRDALTGLLAAFDQARPNLNAAAAQVASHAGFDDQGNVTDLAQAKTTVETIRTELTTARAILAPARDALRSAIAALPRPARGQVPAPPDLPRLTFE